VALPIAERFGLPLTVVYARKLTAPVAPELAFGAIDEDGRATLDPETVTALRLSPEDIEEATARVRKEIERRMVWYGAPPLAHYLPGATVVLVDDGLATGLTLRAALAYARRHGARQVVVATPCASARAGEFFGREADHFVSLVVDEQFQAVGQYYRDFSPVHDDEVLAMLARAEQHRRRAAEADSALGISFSNERGWRLAGDVILPGSPGRHPVVIFAHDRSAGRKNPADRAVAEALRDEGFGSLLFDWSGHGDSEGSPGDCSLEQQVEDLGAALDALETLDELDAGRVGVMGTRSGAAVALLRGAKDPRIRALVLRSADPKQAADAAPHVTAPTLLVVAEQDESARRASEALLTRLGGPRWVELVEGAGPGLDPAALRQAAALALGWFTAHLR
jgi:putative phosphoribosyl transferase